MAKKKDINTKYMNQSDSKMSEEDLFELIGATCDVANRKKTLEALRQSEERYRSLIEELGEAVYRMSLPDGKYEYFNPAARLVFGYTKEDFLRNPLFIRKIIHPDYMDYFERKWADLIKGEVPPTYEYKIIDPEGNERSIIQSNKGIFDDKGNIIAIEGICRNITDRKLKEQLVQAAREYAENIIATVPLSLLVLKPDLRVTLANRSFYQTFKVTPKETIGQLIYEVDNRQWDIPRLRDLLEHILPEHTTIEGFEVEHDFTALGRRVMLLNAQRIFRESNHTDLVLLVIQDITERKRAEEELRKHREHLEVLVEQRAHAPKLLSYLMLLDLPDAVLAVIDFVLAAIRFLPLPRGGVRRR